MAISRRTIEVGITLVWTNQPISTGGKTEAEKVIAMPARKRQRRERTHNWQEIQQYTLWPEQEIYEKIRPVVLYGETAASHAKEIGASERTISYQAKRFEQEGMRSLLLKERAPSPESGRSLPPEVRQLIVDLKAEHPGFCPHKLPPSVFCVLSAGHLITPSSVCWQMDRRPQ